MEHLLDCLLRNIVDLRDDIFGEDCTFLRFDPDEAECDWTSGYQSTARFGRILYQRDGQQHSSGPIVLKVIPKVLLFREFACLAFFNEIFFYTRILPYFEGARKISHLFPLYYNSLVQYNVDYDHGAIAFENLQANGAYVPIKQKTFVDFHHLALMMRKLGEFHAYSYHLRKEDPDQFYPLANSFVETSFIVNRRNPNIIAKLSVRGLEAVAADPKYSSKAKSLRKLIDSADDVIVDIMTGDSRNQVTVLCHGDYLKSNVLFKYEQGKPVDLKMIDMATCRLASPAVDLVQFLYINADQQTRTQHWDELIDIYYVALRDTFPGSDVPSKETILNEFKSKAILAYFVASFFLPLLLAKEYNLPMLEDLTPEPYEWREDLVGLPEEVYMAVANAFGGDLATEALANIFKDMIDRDFL